MEKLAALRILLGRGSLRNLNPQNLIKKKLNILSYQQKKTQIYEVLKFSSMSFYILKLLQDSLLLIVIIYCRCG